MSKNQNGIRFLNSNLGAQKILGQGCHHFEVEMISHLEWRCFQMCKVSKNLPPCTFVGEQRQGVLHEDKETETEGDAGSRWQAPNATSVGGRLRGWELLGQGQAHGAEPGKPALRPRRTDAGGLGWEACRWGVGRGWRKRKRWFRWTQLCRKFKGCIASWWG